MAKKERKKNKIKHTITIYERRDENGEFQLENIETYLGQCPREKDQTIGQRLSLALTKMVKSEDGMSVLAEWYADYLRKRNSLEDKVEEVADKVLGQESPTLQ